jgi:hypothetical protein
MNYKRCIEIVCAKVKQGISVNENFIEYIITLFENNLNAKVEFEINPDVEEEGYIDYPVFALGEIIYEYENELGKKEEKQYIIFLTRHTSGDNLILNVEIGVEENYAYKGIMDAVYKLKTDIKNILGQVFKNIYWQYDEHNNSVCKELYGEIHTLENEFRQLIIEFMVKSYGYEWDKGLVNKVLKNKIIKYSTWYKQNYDEFKDVYIDLFNLQVNDLIIFLRSVYETEKVQVSTEDYFKKKSVSNRLHEKGTDTILETMKIDLNKILEENSIWSLYVSDILGKDFIDLWEKFEKMRNMVAHNKPICNKLYNDFIETEELLKSRFECFARYIRENFDFKNKEKMDMLVNRRNIEIQEYEDMYRNEAGLESLPCDQDDVFEEINEHDSFIEFINVIEEYVEVFKSMAEDLVGYLEDLDIDTIDEELKSRIIFNIINHKDVEISDECVIEEINKMVDVLNDEIGKIEYVSTISFGNIAKLYGLWDECLQLDVEGYICIEEGHTDELMVELKSNENIIKEGSIIKTYGEYSISDYGTAMPEVEDYLGVDLNEIQDYLEEKFNSTIERLTKYINVFEDQI